MLACTEEDNRTLRCSYSTQGTTTLGITIQLSDDDLTNFDCCFECFCLIVTRLTDATIHDKDTGIWLDRILDLNHFFE